MQRESKGSARWVRVALLAIAILFGADATDDMILGEIRSYSHNDRPVAEQQMPSDATNPASKGFISTLSFAAAAYLSNKKPSAAPEDKSQKQHTARLTSVLPVSWPQTPTELDALITAFNDNDYKFIRMLETNIERETSQFINVERIQVRTHEKKTIQVTVDVQGGSKLPTKKLIDVIEELYREKLLSISSERDKCSNMELAASSVFDRQYSAIFK